MPARTVLNTEFMALANHRKVIGAELKAYAERVRDIETAAVTMVLRANGVDSTPIRRSPSRCSSRRRREASATKLAVGVTAGPRRTTRTRRAPDRLADETRPRSVRS